MPNENGFTDFASELNRRLGAVGITDGSHFARIDHLSGSLEIIDTQSHETHEGNHFFIKTFLSNTGSTGTVNRFAFTTPDSTKRIHAKALFSADVDTEISLYEDATIANGTPVSVINNDRESETVAGLVAVAEPTISVAGTKFWTARNGGGKNPIGVSPGLNYKIIAKRNSTYVFEIIKRTTADLIVDVDFWWYEREAYDSMVPNPNPAAL